ncbi:PF11457 family protein [Streptococcus sp. AS20]|uniref:DUF3021 domain-containing protein n=1 Tax=Streptococcus sp. AS20 TaxID=936578 RepID=UPI00044A4E85|nr:DUF3021 domain-containing protein [Streptococcus sp. AS20]EUB23697.1 PF11457 family protein [Streptococcus sp. AS20]
MKKTLFRDALGGTVIGLLLSTIYSYFFAPVYHPLNPYSAVGLWMEQHHIHEALVVLYCAVIWSFIGLLFSLGKELFKKDWSILKATICHYGLMILGFIPLALLAGWFPSKPIFILQLILEFTVVYLILWAVMSYLTKKKIEQINNGLKKQNQ